MTYKGFMTGIVAAGLAAVATSALAFGPGFGPRGGEEFTFETLDLDGNGQVTREEMQAFGLQRFSKADTDGDGVLSEAELVAAAQARAAERVTKMVERFDKNGDGALSPEEMPRPDAERSAMMFDVIDSDDNGTITVEEFDIMKERMSKRGHMWRHGRHDSKEPKN